MQLLIIYLHHAKTGGVVGFVAQAQVYAQGARFEPVFQRAVQSDGWLAAGQVGDFAVAPRHRHHHAQTNRFAKRLFGRKARGQITHAALGPARAAAAPCGQFGVAQDARGKALAVAL